MTLQNFIIISHFRRNSFWSILFSFGLFFAFVFAEDNAFARHPLPPTNCYGYLFAEQDCQGQCSETETCAKYVAYKDRWMERLNGVYNCYVCQTAAWFIATMVICPIAVVVLILVTCCCCTKCRHRKCNSSGSSDSLKDDNFSTKHTSTTSTSERSQNYRIKDSQKPFQPLCDPSHAPEAEPRYPASETTQVPSAMHYYVLRHTEEIRNTQNFNAQPPTSTLFTHAVAQAPQPGYGLPLLHQGQVVNVAPGAYQLQHNLNNQYSQPQPAAYQIVRTA